MEIITDQIPHPPPNAYCAIDLEVFALNPKQIHRPTSGKFACCSFCYEPGTVYVCTDEKKLPDYIQAVNAAVWLMHYSKFDLVHLRRWSSIPPRTKLVDTHLIERILWNGWYDTFDLAALARRYLDLVLDKTPQKEFESATELSPRLLEYAASDAEVTLRIWNEQKKHLTTTDMRVYKEIDLPALWAVLDFRGFRLDVEKWKALAEENKIKQKQIDEQLPFNPRSSQQVVRYLSERGYKIKDSQADTLEEQIAKHPDKEATPYASKVLESRKYGKRASTYGMNFIEDYLEAEDGYHVIHPSYNIVGAETGRMSCSDPNMQNIPARDTKDYRYCFIPRPGNVLIVGDYSSQEPRILAYNSQDRHLIEIFRRGGNVYIETCKDVFHREITKSDALYGQMKSTFLGLDYGMSAKGLATKEGIELVEADELVGAFFRTFPRVKDYIANQSTKKKMVQTVAGRKIWLNSYSDQCERNALNGPIQGSAADMMKKALACMHQEWSFDYPFACVGVVHDEVIFDVPEAIAPQVKEYIQRIMCEVGERMCPGIPFQADVSIAQTWADK